MLTRFPSRGCIVLLLFLLVEPDSLPAQNKLLPVIHFNRLTTADGLPSNDIRSNVVRDRQGFIWVGTEYGLARYDGYSCKVYREFRTPGNAIRLHIDAKGRLWVGRYSSGLSLYDPLPDRFINFLPRRGDSLWFPGQYIGSFLEDNKGTLWLGFADGQVARLDLGSAWNEVRADSVAVHLRFRTINDSKFKGWVERVTSWDEKTILVSSGGGLFLVHQETGGLSRPDLPKIEGLDPDTTLVPILFRETPQRLWIGTRSHGLFLFDRSTGTLTGFHKRRSDGTKSNDPRIHDIQMDRAGRLWIATVDGVDLFDPVSGEYKDFLPASKAPGKSQFSQMSLDSTGTLWISTFADGVFFVPPSLLTIPTYSLRGSSGGPMKVETIDRWTDGSYWMGGEGKLANIRLEDLKVLRTVDLFQGEKVRWDGGMTSFDDSKGRIWYGTWGLGMYSFEPGTGRIRNFRTSHQLSHASLGEDVCASIRDMSGDTLLIAGYNESLLAFDTRFNRFSKFLSPTAQPLHLLRDTAGKIWISDEFLGLFLLDPFTKQVEFFEHDQDNPRSLSDSHPRVTYQDPSGRMWIGCKDLNLWEPESRTFRSYPNNTFSETVRAIPVGTDCRGNLWVSYDPRGISLLGPDNAKFTNLDYSDGFMFSRKMLSLQDGRVLLAGSAGVIIVHPDSLPTTTPAPPFLITAMSVGDTTYIPSAQLASDSRMDLPHDKNVLEFSFAAIDPGASHLIRYMFRLDGLEGTWLESGDRRSIRYAGLTPGHYIFMARAISTLGRWPDQEIALAITIVPPWWQTGWFRIAAVAAIVSLFVLVYRREVTRARRDKQIQQQFSSQQLVFQEAERKRVAAEIHDGLGQSLLIAANELRLIVHDRSRSQTRLKQVTSLIQQSIDSAREISANLHPHHLSRFGFCTAIKALARTSSHSSAAVIETSCDDIDELLPETTRLHLYRIIQEALANAVRYAQARQIQVSVSKGARGISAVIRDDGIGFIVKDFSATRATDSVDELHRGFGISSMSERARTIGGIFTIESSPGSGTVVSVVIPLT